MSAYFRKLEEGELWQDGDIMFYPGLPVKGPVRFRPVTITEAVPAHRVEDETWEVVNGIHIGVRGEPVSVCQAPDREMTGFRHWPQRAKRICAGQTALQLLDRNQPHGNSAVTIWADEIVKILDSLK